MRPQPPVALLVGVTMFTQGQLKPSWEKSLELRPTADGLGTHVTERRILTHAFGREISPKSLTGWWLLFSPTPVAVGTTDDGAPASEVVQSPRPPSSRPPETCLRTVTLGSGVSFCRLFDLLPQNTSALCPFVAKVWGVWGNLWDLERRWWES